MPFHYALLHYDCDAENIRELVTELRSLRENPPQPRAASLADAAAEPNPLERTRKALKDGGLTQALAATEIGISDSALDADGSRLPRAGCGGLRAADRRLPLGAPRGCADRSPCGHPRAAGGGRGAAPRRQGPGGAAVPQ